MMSLKQMILLIYFLCCLFGATHGVDGADGMPPCSSEPKPARRQLPPQAAVWSAKLVERDDGLMVFRSDSGSEFINVGVFGEQLAVVRKDVALTKRQSASLAWLKANGQRLGADGAALVWRSDYETNYNTLVFAPPWSGGYGQASIISGFLALHDAQADAG